MNYDEVQQGQSDHRQRYLFLLGQRMHLVLGLLEQSLSWRVVLEILCLLLTDALISVNPLGKVSVASAHRIVFTLSGLKLFWIFYNEFVYL